jgi:hypothetical protein
LEESEEEVYSKQEPGQPVLALELGLVAELVLVATLALL